MLCISQEKKGGNYINKVYFIDIKDDSFYKHLSLENDVAIIFVKFTSDYQYAYIYAEDIA